MISSSNRINSRKGPVSAARQDAAPTPAGTVQHAPTPVMQGTEGGVDTTVTFNGLTTELQALSVSGAADIDYIMVADVKKALADGTYVIDTGRIADSLLATARAILAGGAPRAGGAG